MKQLEWPFVVRHRQCQRAHAPGMTIVLTWLVGPSSISRDCCWSPESCKTDWYALVCAEHVPRDLWVLRLGQHHSLVCKCNIPLLCLIKLHTHSSSSKEFMPVYILSDTYRIHLQPILICQAYATTIWYSLQILLCLMWWERANIH